MEHRTVAKHRLRVALVLAASLDCVQFLSAGDLHSLIEHGFFKSPLAGEVNLVRVLDCATQVARQLLWLAYSNHSHCDLKPPNILVTKRWNARLGEWEMMYKLADFGLCVQRPVKREVKCVLDAKKQWETRRVVSVVGVGGGTEVFSAPEQLRDEHIVGPPQDSFSLGALVVELTAGVGGAKRAGVGIKCASALGRIVCSCVPE